MSGFKRHDLSSAPAASVPLLEQSRKQFGRIPGLHAVMAESPQVLEGYQRLHQLVLESSFDDVEKTVVWQTINVENACHYCVPAHTAIAKMMKVPDAVTEALRNETPLPEPKWEALRAFTLAVMRKRGNVDQADLDRFFEAGYSHRQVLEVILVLAQKTLSNYINHIARTPLDEQVRQYAWSKQDAPRAQAL